MSSSFLHVVQLPAGWAYVPSASQKAPPRRSFENEVDPDTGRKTPQTFPDRAAAIAAGERWLRARERQVAGNANLPGYTLVEHKAEDLEP